MSDETAHHRADGRADALGCAGGGNLGAGAAIDLVDGAGQQLLDDLVLVLEVVGDDAARIAELLLQRGDGERLEPLAGDDGARGADDLRASERA